MFEAKWFRKRIATGRTGDEVVEETQWSYSEKKLQQLGMDLLKPTSRLLYGFLVDLGADDIQ